MTDSPNVPVPGVTVTLSGNTSPGQGGGWDVNTPQQLADRLAELAGWKYEPRFEGHKPWYHDGCPWHEHPFPVGSIDALEAFRREQLAGWAWHRILLPDPWDDPDNPQSPVEVTLLSRMVRKKGLGEDEWTARAAALVAAKEQSK